MGTTPKRGIALSLALVLALSLCGCPQQQQTESGKPAVNTGAGALPPISGTKRPEQQPEKVDTPPPEHRFSEKAQNSLDWLREQMDFPQTMFGMAYLDYVGGLFEDGFEAGFPVWLEETNRAMLEQYPFLGEIDPEHIVGGAGHLYCIVPVDENATVSINRVQWNESTAAQEVTQVLYRSEGGDPVLLFANLDGVAYEDDTQVIITDNAGNTCEWYPSLDAMSYLVPCVSETGDYRSFDFTEYPWRNAPSELVPWLADGWTGMTALGLAGSEDYGLGWLTETTAWETDRRGIFCLRFYPGDETGGRVDLDWRYEGSDAFEEMWSGFWTIQTVQDGPSYVTLSLSLVGGRGYGDTDGPMYLSETYPLLISPSGTELLVAEGEHGVCLPFLSQGTLACVLTQVAG